VASPSFINVLQEAILATGSFVLLACIYLMYRRQQHRVFPVFFSYLAAVLVNNWIRRATHILYPGNSAQYFYVYWITDVINVGISFAVLYEVLKNVLTAGTIKVSRSTFFLIVALLLLASVTLSYFTTPPAKDPVLFQTILLAEGAVRFAQIGVLLVFAALTLFFGFYWGNQAFGISAGFGSYAAVMFVNARIRQRVGLSDSTRYAMTDITMYTIATLIWFFYALKRPKVPIPGQLHDQISTYSEPISRMIK
jgi:hypothetical protein